jgi:outer membrane protein W
MDEVLKKYVVAFEEIEKRIVDYNKFPVVKDNKIKKRCQMTLAITKIFFNNIRFLYRCHRRQKQIEK